LWRDNYWKDRLGNGHDIEHLTDVTCSWLLDFGGQRSDDGKWILPPNLPVTPLS
jgi:hypothetical protein